MNALLTRLPRISWPQLIWRNSLLPMMGLLCFLLFWQIAASQITTSLGTLPGPMATAQQFGNLVAEHQRERAKEQAFYERQNKRNASYNFV